MTHRLRDIRAIRYGGLRDCGVGPFAPGLNVVLGPNEAGKSTLASLVRAVLFGWEDAHGVRNTYRPDEGDRAGELVFAELAQPDGAGRADRAVIGRDEGGAYGQGSLVSDIDRETFDAVFSFSADDLRSLRNSSDVTARLLTAASGTGSSPADAFAELEGAIAATTREIQALSERLERMHERVKREADRAALSKQESRELRALAASRTAVSQRIEAFGDEIEGLIVYRGELESLDEREGELAAELDALRVERAEAVSRRSESTLIDARLLALDSAGERVLRDRIDELAEARGKADRMLDTAQENCAASTAAYEALVELDEGEGSGERKAARAVRLAVSIVLPIAFMVAGVPLFMYGRSAGSLSFTALGGGLVLSAFILAVAAIVVAARPSRGEAELDGRRKDAQWVMLQDRKKLDASQAACDRLSSEIGRFLDEAGLGAASGSLRQARTLLDEAADQRALDAASGQRAQAIDLRIRELQGFIDKAVATRVRIGDAVGISDVAARDLDALVRKRTAERDALVEGAEDMSQRIGELARGLDFARGDDSFALAKLERQQINARLRGEKHALVELLLAKRLLDRGIAAWESQSQPEVYARAGSLLATITDGRWVEVATSRTGSLVTIDREGVERDPRHLSLGTCQQLYLALRIALLLNAPDVGRSVPVLADDILVNFDASRRVGAARALAELAHSRQVIVFTCHEETARILESAGAHLLVLPTRSGEAGA